MAATRRAFMIGVTAAALSGCMRSAGAEGTIRVLPQGTRLVLVRHFDRDGDALSAAGRGRAAALPQVISDIPLDAIYTRHIDRNRDSTRPLAQSRGLEMEILSSAGSNDDIHEQVIDLAAGRSIIWIGNSTNLRPIWEALGLPGPAPVTFGELVVVEPDQNGVARVTDRRIVPVPD